MVFVHMFMICLHTGLHMSSYNGSLFIAIKPNVKYRFRTDAILIYILQKNDRNTSCMFFE